MANHCTWTLSLGTLFLLDQNILLAEFGPKEFFGPKERCGQVIRMAKRNDTVSLEIVLALCEFGQLVSLVSLKVVLVLGEFGQLASFVSLKVVLGLGEFRVT